MSVKNEVIILLEEHRNIAISGQQLANKLNVSRAAIWKAINALKQEGYNIEATPNRGYLLLEESDILSSQSISYYLDRDIEIQTYKTIDSTNTKMKELAVTSDKDCLVIVAEEQTAGRGRFSRSFYSPAKTGIYMSVMMKRQESFEDATLITIHSAVAVTRAIKKLYDLDTEIKWVNDIYYQGKKICGILTEAISDFESGMIEAIIIGIGINVSTSEDSFLDELKDIATSLGIEKPNRNQFIGEILNQLFAVVNEDFMIVLDEYRRKSCVLNKEIEFDKNGQKFKGYVKDINELGNLVVDCNDSQQVLSFGEVRIIGGINETK